MRLVRSALVLVLLLHVSSLGGCVKGDTSSTTEADPQDPSTEQEGPPEQSIGTKEDVKGDPVSDLSTAAEKDKKAAEKNVDKDISADHESSEKEKEAPALESVTDQNSDRDKPAALPVPSDEVVSTENANGQSQDPSKTVDDTKEKSTGEHGGKSPDEQKKIAVVEAATEPTIRGEPAAPQDPAVHPATDGGIQASTISDTGVGQQLATGEPGARGVLPGTLPPPPVVITVHTPAPGVDVKVGGDTHVTHTGPEIAKQTSVADSSSPAVVPLVTASNPSDAGNAQGNPVIGNKGEKDPKKVVASDHVKRDRSLTGENTQKEKVTIADASEVKTVVSTGNGGKTEVKSEVGITDKNTKNKPGKTENSPEEVDAKETKERTKEESPKTADKTGGTGEKVQDSKKKPHVSGGGTGTVMKSVPPKADATPDKGDKTTTGAKVLPKVSVTVPPMPVVNKTTTLSATAISSTIPAVLITSVVFLYLYNW